MTIRSLTFAALAVATACALGGCTFVPDTKLTGALPVYPQKTTSEVSLNVLPPPEHPIAVAVYGFTDQTGQFKTQDTGQTLSRAVTQGGGSILVKALRDTGDGKWFTVVEREQLRDLLTERQIITEMRQRYLGENGVNPQALPALLFAGVILEGGIISYDTNTMTGGAGAAILGVGANGTYKQDTVTVYLRAVSVKTGEVLATVTASKTIKSKALQNNIFAYVASDKILENEMGYTTNEPGQIALQQAIEKAVYGLVMEGVQQKLWSFADNDAGWPYLWGYQQERNGYLTAEQVDFYNNQARGQRDGKRAGKPAGKSGFTVPPPPVNKDGGQARTKVESARPLAALPAPSSTAPAAVAPANSISTTFAAATSSVVPPTAAQSQSSPPLQSVMQDRPPTPPSAVTTGG